MKRNIAFCLLFFACSIVSIQGNCSQEVLSIVMVLDASASVLNSGFELGKKTMIEMINQMNIGPAKIRVGTIYYDTKVFSPTTLVETNHTRQYLITTIENEKYSKYGGNTATGLALDAAFEQFKKTYRPAVPKIVVLFTDGYSNFGPKPIPIADKIKADGTEIFVLGIGNSINAQEIAAISSGSNYVMRVSNYQQLYSVVNEITIKTCDVAAFLIPGQKASIEAGPNEKRNFQTDLTKLRNQSTAKTSYIIIDMDVFAGFPMLTYSLNDPISSKSNIEEAKPVEERINPDNSRTISFWVSFRPTDKRLYYSVKGSQPGVNIKYDLSVHTL